VSEVGDRVAVYIWEGSKPSTSDVLIGVEVELSSAPDVGSTSTVLSTIVGSAVTVSSTGVQLGAGLSLICRSGVNVGYGMSVDVDASVGMSVGLSVGATVSTKVGVMVAAMVSTGKTGRSSCAKAG
jgi:hypothetical protein